MRSPPRAAYDATALLALIVLIAAASHGAPVSLPLRAGRADRMELIAIAAVVAISAAAVASGVALVIHRMKVSRNAEGHRLGNLVLRGFPILMVALSALSLATIARIEMELAGEAPIRIARYVSAAPRDAKPVGMSDRRQGLTAQEKNPDMEAVEFLVPERVESRRVLARAARTILAVVACALLVMYAVRRYASRPLAAGGDASMDEAAVHEALVDTIGSMLTDSDPNTAVIGAYARLLENLESCGIGRLAHEAPREHLHRVLTAVRVRPAPLNELISLFEIARFSSRRVTTADRNRALDALHVIAAELATALPAGLGSEAVVAGARR